MIQMGFETKISNLQDFPWSEHSYSEVSNLIEYRKITPVILYDPDVRHFIFSRKEKIFSDIVGNLMFLIPVFFIAMAIWIKQWLYLFGCPGFIISAYVSNPWSIKIRQYLIGISLIIVIASVYMSYNIIAFIFGGLFISLLLAVFAREYVNNVVKRKITKSELIFCYTFQAGLLLLKDSSTGKIYRK